MNCFKIHTANREFSLYGGLLYLDGTPVQSYFPKNMFYWEAEKERGALYLYHHGLMAQSSSQKTGTGIHNASTEQHYTISYRQQGKVRRCCGGGLLWHLFRYQPKVPLLLWSNL